jgi:Domain of unknown function (DUF222)/HNH endonuclease
VSVVCEENRELVELEFGELVEQLTGLAAHLSAGMSRWLELVAEIDGRGKLVGCTTAQWLAWRCGLTPRTAREHVRVARSLAGLPLIREAFSRGQLSYAKVRALCRLTEAGDEQRLLRLALEMTASQLERALRALRRVTSEQAAAVQERAYLDCYFDEDGSLVFRGRLAPEEGAVFMQAIDQAFALLREGGSAEPRPTKADALAAMAERSLSGSPRSGGERTQVVVHVDETALAGASEGGCELDEGPALSPETARRLACDASVVELRERDGEPLSVGRKTRSVPPALRRALKRRDRGCRFPGCEHHRFVDAHHVRHWAQGGETSLDNLVLLCRRHHRQLHEGGYSVERLESGGLRFRYPWGGPIPDSPRPPPGSLECLLERNRRLAIDGTTYHHGYYERMDLDLTVSALLTTGATAHF